MVVLGTLLGLVLILGLQLVQKSWAQATSTAKTSQAPQASEVPKTDQTSQSAHSGQTSQEKMLPNFNSVVLSGLGNLYITQGRNPGLIVKTEAELIPLISATVQDNTLHLDFKNAEDHSRAEVNYYLTVKDINSIQSYSSSTVFIKEGIETNSLTLSIKSFGDMIVTVKVNNLIAKIEGAGRIRAAGSATTQDIQIAGTGEFMGSELNGQKGSVLIEGSGIARVNVSDALSIRVTKEGTVEYCGKPNLAKALSAKAIVQPLDNSLCSK